MNKKFSIGCFDTTASRWQVEQVTSLINPSGYESESLFFPDTNQLEKALLDGAIDLLILAPDQLPLELPEELELIALTERLQVNSVLVSINETASLTDEGIRVGVTSKLKLAFVNRYYPKAVATLELTPQAGVEKLGKGLVDLLAMNYDEALAFGYEKFIRERIETSYFVPAVGQGSLGILCHKKLSFKHKEVLQRWVNHEETEDCIRAERSFLNALSGNENLLPFSYAHFEGALITLKAGLLTSDGKEIFKTKKSAVLGESRELGKKVALEVARLLTEQRLQVI